MGFQRLKENIVLYIALVCFHLLTWNDTWISVVSNILGQQGPFSASQFLFCLQAFQQLQKAYKDMI